MPGGLARVAPDSAEEFITMQRGGGSKDTWIPSASPVAEVTLLHTAGQSVELRRTGNNLPSRLADNFFWLGRYAERADATARLLRSVLRRFTPERNLVSPFWFVPVKDLLQVAFWLGAFIGNTVEWRGQRMKIRGDGTLVEAK